MTQAIVISGKAMSGKDTTANIMRKILEDDGHRVLIAHYADLLKYICKTFFGWNGEKDEYGRSLLQRIGTDVFRKEDPNFWVDFIAYIIELFPDEWDYVLIPDARFPNEIDRMRNYHCIPTLHVRVVRPGFDSGLTQDQRLHESETALDDVSYEYVINNCGDMEELQYKVLTVINSIVGPHQYTIEKIAGE